MRALVSEAVFRGLELRDLDLGPAFPLEKP